MSARPPSPTIVFTTSRGGAATPAPPSADASAAAMSGAVSTRVPSRSKITRSMSATAGSLAGRRRPGRPQARRDVDPRRAAGGRGRTGVGVFRGRDARELVGDRIRDEARTRREHVAIAQAVLLADEEAQRVD